MGGCLVVKHVFDDKIDYISIIDENGNADAALFPKDVDDTLVLRMYMRMGFARDFDAKLLSLQRQGRAVTYAPLLGEEATQIGSAFAMGEKDIFVPSFRQHAVQIERGIPLELLFVYWMGFEEGCVVSKPLRYLTNAVPVSTQLPHASGIAFAQKYNNTGAAVVVYVGDGGTSEGDFYEALNFAGVWKVPLVVIIENNQWAISIPRAKQSAALTLAQKAFAAGIEGMQVDGNDVVAVYMAVKDAIRRSLSEGGPFVIEAITYRMGMHTTADDPTKYRDSSDEAVWKKRDPLLRISRYLSARGLWDDDKEKALHEENVKTLDAALEKAEKFIPDPSSVFKNVYSFMPDVLSAELAAGEDAGYWLGD